MFHFLAFVAFTIWLFLLSFERTLLPYFSLLQFLHLVRSAFHHFRPFVIQLSRLHVRWFSRFLQSKLHFLIVELFFEWSKIKDDRLVLLLPSVWYWLTCSTTDFLCSPLDSLFFFSFIFLFCFAAADSGRLVAVTSIRIFRFLCCLFRLLVFCAHLTTLLDICYPGYQKFFLACD